MTEAPRKDCPLCGGELASATTRPMQIDVCGTCYQDLRTGGAIPLHATAEFAAVTPEQAEQMMRAQGRPRSLSSDLTIVCTWCGKSRAQVKKILSSGSAHLCNECVALCAQILEDELGGDWR